MSSTVLIVVGVVKLALGGALTLFAFFNRDPETGQFVVWYKTLIGGAVLTFFGFVWRQMEDESPI